MHVLLLPNNKEMPSLKATLAQKTNKQTNKEKQNKNARLFTITLLLTIAIFAKISPELKYKIFPKATSPSIKKIKLVYTVHTLAP